MSKSTVLHTSPEEKYETQIELYEGKYSSVYIGKLKNSPGEPTVVIKRNTNSVYALNEIKAYKKLNNSEKFLKVFDVCEKFTIVLERCMCNLQDIFELRRVFPEEQKNLAFQFLSGLNEIHEKKLVHRDIKMKNVLLTYDGVLKICDFESVTENDTFQQLKGRCTPGYVPLEVLISTKPLPVNFTQDLWAAGIVLMRIFTENIRLFSPSITNYETDIKLTTRIFGCPTGPFYESLPGYVQYYKWARSYKKNNIRENLEEWMSAHSVHEVDLVEQLLQVEPSERRTAFELLHASTFVVDPLPSVNLKGAIKRYMKKTKITRPPPHEAEEIDLKALDLKYKNEQGSSSGKGDSQSSSQQEGGH
ncbi:hypothetical protein LSTR_LSTR009806 [Laodelphax striatellus]|uniref:Protein kinase domain-containing protein n=1 Tax=Laodelphax striatellus TaxID=195883 RepID=A0A482XMG1_LAOST|nr:hypothetical protein LSTR_LSTR009806 [Laodelphax striatellus]